MHLRAVFLQKHESPSAVFYFTVYRKRLGSREAERERDKAWTKINYFIKLLLDLVICDQLSKRALLILYSVSENCSEGF